MRIKNVLKMTGLSLSVMALSLMAMPTKSAQAYSYTTGKGCTAYNYRSGSTGTCVRYIQSMINAVQLSDSRIAGYNPSFLAVDGIFGSKTQSKIKAYQSVSAGLAVDGIVGPATWNRMCSVAGQVAWSDPSWSSVKYQAWSAAYYAGCKVETRSSYYPGYRIISRY